MPLKRDNSIVSLRASHCKTCLIPFYLRPNSPASIHCLPSYALALLRRGSNPACPRLIHDHVVATFQPLPATLSTMNTRSPIEQDIRMHAAPNPIYNLLSAKTSLYAYCMDRSFQFVT